VFITFLSLTASDWITFALSILVITPVILLSFFIAKFKWHIIPLIAFIFGMFVSYLFTQLSILTLTLLLVSLMIFIIIMFVNIGELRTLVTRRLSIRKKIVPRGRQYDKDTVYQAITDTVHYLSKTKTGAIISIERTTSLGEYCKNGTMINAPLTSELLMTLFYPGTRLHDGAVIIRGNTILAASVYFAPTTKPLSGKYGSRHRAALGISEISDAVTIIVSEETGRISIAYNGELEPVFIDNFKQLFLHYMDAQQSSNIKE
jgi:diadenylate cyclase